MNFPNQTLAHPHGGKHRMPGSVLLRDLMVYLHAEREQFCRKWLRKNGNRSSFKAKGREVVLSEVRGLYDNYLTVLETGGIQALQDINRKLQVEIEERKRMEDALRKSEEHYHALFNEACLMQENLRNLSHKLLHAQEEERKHISRELHDEMGQLLPTIKVYLTLLNRAALKGDQEFEKKSAQTQLLMDQLIEKVHEFSRELRPPMLDDLGLVPALRAQLRDFGQRTGLDIRFNVSGSAEGLSNDQKTVLYRIAQESLTNVAKHAKASRVEVSLRALPGAVHLDVCDNGKAFRVERKLSDKGKKHLGLLGMRERVQLVNGSFTVESQRGKGTAIRVLIPNRTTP